MTTHTTPPAEVLHPPTQTQPHWARLAHGHTWVFNGQLIDISSLTNPDTVDRNAFETCFLNQINVMRQRQGCDTLQCLPPVLSQFFLQVNAKTFHASDLDGQVIPYCVQLASRNHKNTSEFVALPYNPQIWVKTFPTNQEKKPIYHIEWASDSNALILKTCWTPLQYQSTEHTCAPLHITRTIQLRFDSNKLHCTYTKDNLLGWYSTLTEISDLFHKIFPLMDDQALPATQTLYDQLQTEVLSAYPPVRSYQQRLLSQQSDNNKCTRHVIPSRSGRFIEETFFRYPDNSSESFICIAPDTPPVYDITEDPKQSGNLIAKVTIVPLLYTDEAHDTYETLSVTYTYHYHAEQSEWILDKAPPIYTYSNDTIRGEWWLAIGCLLPAGGLELAFPQLLPFSSAFIILGCVFIVRARLGDTDSISLPPADALNHLKSEALRPLPAISRSPSPEAPQNTSSSPVPPSS